MTQLMISVQNLKEALEAYHLGADFIDLKDPSSGPLSPIPAPVARRICRELPPQVTLSQALGEWKDWRETDQEQQFEPFLTNGPFFLAMVATTSQCVFIASHALFLLCPCKQQSQ